MRILRRLSFWLGARRRAADLAAEMEDHRARLQAAYEADGMSRAEAAIRSRRAMGNVTLAREDARGVWVFGAVERIWRDALYGLRGLRREPTFALTAMLTLALGVATTTTVFSVTDSELWKPWPLPGAARLVMVVSKSPGANGLFEYVSGVDVLAWQRQAQSFEALGAMGNSARGVLRGATARTVSLRPVTSDYFSAMGWPVVEGRTLAASDAPGGHATLVSERAWERLFDRDPGVIGRTLIVDDTPLTVVGVLRTIDGLGARGDFFPVIDPRSPEFRDPHATTITNVVARLRPDVAVGAAQAEMAAVASRVARDYPGGRTGHTIELWTMDSFYAASNNARKLFFFLGAALVVLLLSCANVANLILARALTRRREFAIRGALGGGSIALARQLIVEGAVLALPAGLLGLLLTSWALGLVRTRLPADYLFHGTDIPVDVRVGGFALALSFLTAIVFGLMPALFARRVDLNVTLGDGGRTAGRAPGHARLRSTLVAAQVALTLVLLSGAGLFLRSYAMLTRVPLGFDPQQRLGVHVGLSGPRYATQLQTLTFAATALDRVRAVPGVTDAVVATSGPLESGPLLRFVVSGRPRPAAGEEPRAILRSIGPEYFRTLGIRIVKGRAFTAADAAGAPRVAIVNDTLARTVFHDEDPIGRVLEIQPRNRAAWADRPGAVTIVGVSSNVKEIDVNEVDFSDICLPFAQAPSSDLAFFARTIGPFATVSAAVQSAVSAVDPALPVRHAFPLDSLAEASLRGARFNMLLIATFAGAALLIAAVGIYGSLSRAVRERTREFGVRLALGANRSAILGSALRQSVRMLVAGGAAGLFAVFVLGRALGTALYTVPHEHSGILYGISMTDPLTVGVASCALVAVATIASIIPARQATKVDPLVALRTE